MTLKIHRILKNDLYREESLDVVLSALNSTNGMTISHFAYSPKQTEATIPYTIEVVKEFVPKVNIDFCVVIRKKIDLTAVGSNSNTIESIGKDIGKDGYANRVPTCISDLPPGFVELYKG